MSSIESGESPDGLVYIDLDEPTPWWASVVVAIAIVLTASVLVAPWVVNLDDDQQTTVANSTLQNTSSVCRPDADGLPSLLDPTVASWSRFCEWFIAPELAPPNGN